MARNGWRLRRCWCANCEAPALDYHTLSERHCSPLRDFRFAVIGRTGRAGRLGRDGAEPDRHSGRGVRPVPRLGICGGGRSGKRCAGLSSPFFADPSDRGAAECRLHFAGGAADREAAAREAGVRPCRCPVLLPRRTGSRQCRAGAGPAAIDQGARLRHHLLVPQGLGAAANRRRRVAGRRAACGVRGTRSRHGKLRPAG